MAMEYAEDCSVFRCTKCGEITVIEEGENAPDACPYCAGEKVPSRTKDRIIEKVQDFLRQIDKIMQDENK